MLNVRKQGKYLADALARASELADSLRHEFATPEHLLWGISQQFAFKKTIYDTSIEDRLYEYLLAFGGDSVPDDIEYDGADSSMQLEEAIINAYTYMEAAEAEFLEVPHVLQAMFMLEDSYAKNLLIELCDGNVGEFMSEIISNYVDENFEISEEGFEKREKSEDSKPMTGEWTQWTTCLNDKIDSHNPLIGREAELDRTIQVLCRKDKNNPLHVGEPGVGKTALAYGLAARIEKGEVPERLQGCKIFDLDCGALLAGTQYRGDFEKRLKSVLEGLSEAGKAILYIDEIHNIIGAGSVEGSSIDGANLMKPYLESGSLRFMGATTYEEYNRSFTRSKGFARRFEKIDITEPTVEQCRLILQGLKQKYEEFHNVVYTDEAIEYAVTGASKYITGRYLPDKAIDVIDETGAWVEASAASRDENDAEAPVVIGKKEIATVLAKICNVDTLAEDKDDIAQLEHLEQHIKSQIYGQDEAVREVTEAVQLASAGLIDDNKPMASLLFVGPTGVGKTEVARVLAKELSLPLVRFDMSEYAEKHTVAKLIGSPAGYVGYEDGGLLTDAIRKTPHCVLLFDELEKAHQDIYNILLQVMDYAVLTDNKGQKADFRHVIFIMTTNAGAQFARQASIGFSKAGSAGEAMMKSVKATFKPEFLNRLTGITIFHDMNRSMAELILDKKLTQLSEKLAAKKVTMTLSDAARELMLKRGFSEEYGGREIDRVITAELKPLLMRAILFGNLKEGGVATIDVEGETLRILE